MNTFQRVVSLDNDDMEEDYQTALVDEETEDEALSDAPRPKRPAYAAAVLTELDDDAHMFDMDAELDAQDQASAAAATITEARALTPPQSPIAPIRRSTRISMEDFQANDNDSPLQRDAAMDRFRAQMSATFDAPIVMARTFRAEYLPPSPEAWQATFAERPEECWNFLERAFERYTRSPIPTDAKQNLIHLHEMTLLVQLLEDLDTSPEPITKAISDFGERLWDYFTRILYSREAPSNVLRLDWWKLICRLRLIVTSTSPAHATFHQHWYSHATIDTLLKLTNAEAAAYLEWAHEGGWCRVDRPVATSEQGEEEEASAAWDELAIASVLDGPILSDHIAAPHLRPITMYNYIIVPKEWLQTTVSQLDILRTARILSWIHEHYNRLQWTPGTELLIILLWYHVQEFAMGGAEPHLIARSDYAEEVEGVAVANDYFVTHMTQYLVPMLSSIHAFYSMQRAVLQHTKNRECFMGIPVGLYDAYQLFGYDAIPPPGTPGPRPHQQTPDFLPLPREMNLLQTILPPDFWMQNFRPMPDMIFDCCSIHHQYRNTLQTLVLNPGDTAHLARTTIALKLHPRNVLAKLKSGQTPILASLAIDKKIPSILQHAAATGEWPSLQSDLAVFGHIAYATLLHSIFYSLDLMRPAKDKEQRQRLWKDATESVQDAVTDTSRTLHTIVRETDDLFQRARKRHRQIVKQQHVVESRPRLADWWIMTRDNQYTLPFLYPHSLRMPVGLSGTQPRLIFERGHWIVYDPSALASGVPAPFLGRTPHAVEALRMVACRAAFIAPHDYTTHVDPLLLRIFKESMDKYAQAGLVALASSPAL